MLKGLGAENLQEGLQFSLFSLDGTLALESAEETNGGCYAIKLPQRQKLVNIDTKIQNPAWAFAERATKMMTSPTN